MEMPRLELDTATHSAAHQQEPVFLVRDLLWKEIVELLEPVEVDEVRRVLGSSLIDDNEGLHQELLALAEILEIFQEQNDNLKNTLANRARLPDPPVKKMLEQQIAFFIKNIRAKHNNSSSKDTAKDELVPLSTPREREVFTHVLDSTRTGSTREKRAENPFQEMTPRSKDTDRESWETLSRPVSRGGFRPSSRGSGSGSRPSSRGSGSGSRPSSRGSGSGSRPSSRSGSRPSSRGSSRGLPDREEVAVVRELPIRPGSSCGERAAQSGGMIGAPVTSIWGSFARPSSRDSNHSQHSNRSNSNSVEDCANSINLEHIETVSEPLRAALQDEKQALLEDIKFVQECLEEENSTMEQVKKSADCNSPTTEELRVVNSKLEKSYMQQEKDDPLKKTLSKVPARKPTFSPHSNKPPLAGFGKGLPPASPQSNRDGGSSGSSGIVPGASSKHNSNSHDDAEELITDHLETHLMQDDPIVSPRRAGTGGKKSIRDRLRGSVQDSRDEKYFE